MDICKVLWWLLLLSMINEASSICHDHHCDHICSSGKYQCINHDHDNNHGCHCYPADYCDETDFPCSPSQCPHNEQIRCTSNHKCECYCSLDSDCSNCTEQSFCIHGQCVCESDDYCPGRNQYYCLKNFQCQHNESKRCNSNDRCQCFCRQDSECKNCPEKGFCVNGQCVCESHDFCPKENHLYCMYLDAACSLGFTAKCNGSNRCYCAYVPDTCSGNDVTKCYHLRCRPGEKKFCEGRTCTCKLLDYCEKGYADCGHMTCDASMGEVSLCGTNNTCQCLAIPDFCGGSDTETCTHIKCNDYQVKVCDNGVCKCQLNPSCDSNLGLIHTCTSENTVLEVKINGTKRYKNCTDDNLFPICVDGRCQCIFWKTPSPPSPTIVSTTDMSAQCNTRHDCNQDNTFRIFHNLNMPCPPDNMECFRGKCFCSKERVTTMAVLTTNETVSSSTQSSQKPVTQTSPTTLPTTTTVAAACTSRDNCNQGNTLLMFPGWQMPCPVDHIDCYQNKCFCSPDMVTTMAVLTTDETASSSTQSSQKPVAQTSRTTLPTTTTAAAACTSRDNCNQSNTFMIFSGWHMPCPVDHIDCNRNQCYCSQDRVTTTELPTTPTAKSSIPTTKTSTPTTKTSLSTTKTSILTTKTSIPTTKTPISTTKTSSTTKVTTTEKITETTHRIPATTDSPSIVTTTQPVSERRLSFHKKFGSR